MTTKTKKVGNAEYTKTKVTRQILNPARYSSRTEPYWITKAEYGDALVRDQGAESGALRLPEVMLRAYTNDPDEFWDEEYQQGNGIHVQTKQEAKEFAAYYEDPKIQQYVMDCDNDIALQRVMGYLLKRSNYGGGREDLLVLVSFEDKGPWGSGTREVNEWTGFGDDANVRIEQWSIRLKDES